MVIDGGSKKRMEEEEDEKEDTDRHRKEYKEDGKEEEERTTQKEGQSGGIYVEGKGTLVYLGGFRVLPPPLKMNMFMLA